MILPLSLAQAQTMTPHTITVTGTATIKAAPDNVVIIANLTSADKSAAAALQANKDTVAHLMQILRPFNIAAGQIQMSNMNINNARGPANLLAGQNQQATGNYQITNRMSITLDDISRLPAVLDAITQTGGVLSISEQYGLKDRAALEDRARTEAIANAKHQADGLAAAEGQKLDKMIAMSMTLAPGNYLNTLNLGLLGMQLQDGQIAVTQQVVVEYGLQ
jgi:uncharacterized protein YggE